MGTFVSYTPKSADAIIVQVEPELRVTALFKESKRTISIQESNKLESFYSNHCHDCDKLEDGSCEGGIYILEEGDCHYFKVEDFVETEELEYTTLKHFMSIKSDRNGVFYSDDPLLFAYTSYGMGSGKLNATPYRLANVYDDGKICWGNNFPTNNQSLRTVYNTFWNSIFNNDLVPRDEYDDEQEISDWINKISYKALCSSIASEDYATYIKGKQNIISSNPSEIEGFFFSDNPTVVKRFNKYLIVGAESVRPKNIVVGWLKKETIVSNGKNLQSYYIEVFGQKFDYDTQTGILGDLLVA